MTRLFTPLVAVMPSFMAARVQQNRHTRSTSTMLLVGLVVALLALANVIALTNWHASLLDHDDIAADSVSMTHGHHHHHDHGSDHATASSDTPDRDSPQIDLHALTHAMIHGLAGLVPGMTVALPLHDRASDWFAGRSFALSGISPQALLRPPRN